MPKAKAIERRGFVIPEDVRYIGKDVLCHRLSLTYEAEAEELLEEDIVQRLFGTRNTIDLIPKEIFKKVRNVEIRTKGLVNDLFEGNTNQFLKAKE